MAPGVEPEPVLLQDLQADVLPAQLGDGGGLRGGTEAVADHRDADEGGGDEQLTGRGEGTHGTPLRSTCTKFKRLMKKTVDHDLNTVQALS
ncbi:hypothetical protein SLA_2121 [Streptomyces laurentii]|uniref:Uncharacterized protein n=1 Tax=Streptomyces laurentii TaxID=39478 RepID=A0A160NY72_STRLU|nr:hypothetical protein SLA_2121 [Streptomyces laurentii]